MRKNVIKSIRCTGYLQARLTRLKMHLKMSSTEVNSCKKLPSITDELSIEENSVDPEQTAPIGAV